MASSAPIPLFAAVRRHWLVVLTFGNWDTQYDRIAFFINNEDVVTHIGSSFNAETASYAMPF